LVSNVVFSTYVYISFFKALKSTLEAKEEDLRLYVEMLEGSKRIFLDGLKQYKQIASTEN
jgi:hypothetical protein